MTDYSLAVASTAGNIYTGLSTGTKPTLGENGCHAGDIAIETDTGNKYEFDGGSTWWKIAGPDASGNHAVNAIIGGVAAGAGFNPSFTTNGGSMTLASAAVGSFPDLTQYGYPYSSVTLTNSGANSATIVWSVTNGFMFFQITGTTPDIDLAATNDKGNALSDVPVQALASINPVTGQTLGAGSFILYRP